MMTVFEVPDGEVGNLQVQGESMAAFYTASTISPNPRCWGNGLTQGTGITATGEGYYYYYGRGDDMLKVGNVQVSPIEIESALVSHPAVQEIAVVPKEDEKGLLRPKAFIVLKPGFEPSEELANKFRIMQEKYCFL